MSSEPPSAAPLANVERRIVTVLFADIVGFTPLSERLDPEDVAAIQDAYFASVRATIERYHGLLKKFIGDAAMAVFGAPIARDDDAERGVRAGLALIGAIERLGARLGLEPGDLRLRVGVNSGEVIHATSGPDAGRVTGDTVNTAARLQASAGPDTVLVGELTALAIAATIETRPVGALELKGKSAPVRVWEAVAPRPVPSREEALGSLRAPLLGRDAELERLLTGLAVVRADRSASRLVVVAPPGVGKSRLLHEVGTRAEADAVVRRARVRPQATAPYETVTQLFGPVARGDLASRLLAAGVPAHRADVIEREVARLLDEPSSGDRPGTDLDAERDRRFDGWITALDALADGPQLWLVEDVHWAGLDLLAFLLAAGAAPARHGRLVVATARPSLLDTDPDWCAADRLDLEPLPPADASALVTALVGAALPAELVRAIVERSDGTPLFIEELLRVWASVGTLVRGEAAWTLAVPPTEIALPATVQAIYAAQLDDLPPDARLLARRGAVAGRRLPVDALAALEIGDRTGLDGLRRRALVEGPVHDAVIGDTYAYRHVLLRDAGYASLARAERARLHLAMARWLAEVAGARADVVAEAVAEHLSLALESRPALAATGLPEAAVIAADAAGWAERAAEAALRLAAPDAGRRLMGRAVELTLLAGDATVPAVDLARRYRRHGEVLAASADLDAGVEQLERALEAAPQDSASLAASAYALARARMQQIRFEDAERLTSSTLQRLADAPGTMRARLHALHAWSVAAQGRRDGVVAETAVARELARGAEDPQLELDVLEHVATAHDEVDAATGDDWAELERRALDVGAWHQVVTAGRARAQVRSVEDPRAAAADLVRIRQIADAHGLVEQAGWCDYLHAELRWVLGEWDEAVAIGSEATDLAERNAYVRLAFRTYVVLLALAGARRDRTIAERYARWWRGARSELPATGSPYARMLAAGRQIWLAEATGSEPPLPPPDTLHAVVPMMNPHYLAATEAVVSTWAAAGSTALARDMVDRLVRQAAEPDATSFMRMSAALSRAYVDPSGAATAVELARAEDAPWWTARALRLAGFDTEAAVIERGLRVLRPGWAVGSPRRFARRGTGRR